MLLPPLGVLLPDAIAEAGPEAGVLVLETIGALLGTAPAALIGAAEPMVRVMVRVSSPWP